MNKTDTTKLQIGLISLIFVANIATGITPALADIAKKFPEVGQSKLQMIVSIAAMLSFLASLIAGKLQSYLPQKTVVLTGTFLLSLGTLPIIISNNFNFLLGISVLIGSGSGLMTATIPAMISRYFEGDARTAMLGKKTAFQGLGTMSMTFIGGLLAVYSWQYNYLIFSVAIVALVLGFLFLPNDPVIKKEKKQANKPAVVESESDRHKYTITSPRVLLVLTLAASLMILVSILSNNMALHASVTNIGDSSVAGLALSFYSLGSIIAGFVASKVVGLFKTRTLFASFIIMSIGFAIISSVTFKAGLIAGALVFGLGYGTIMTRLLFLMTSLLKSTAVPVGMSLFSALTSLGFALSPVIVNAVAKLFAGNLATSCFKVGFCGALLIATVLFVSNFESRSIKSVQ